MKLTSLRCGNSQVSDLSPLEDCKSLKSLSATNTKVVLAGVAALQKALPNCKIEWPTEDQFYAQPDRPWNTPAFQQWVKATQALPAEKQIEAVSKKLMELNPGFDGKVTGAEGRSTPKIVMGVVTEIGFLSDNVTDISPVRALAGLKRLDCRGLPGDKDKLSDLSPLQGMKLTWLFCGFTKVSDLSPLQGMPLTFLHCQGTQVSDLSPLQGMKLTQLVCWSTKVSDLSPLRGMPLSLVACGDTKVPDLSPLEDCKSLKSLVVTGTKITPASVAALQKALPNCEIKWDDPAKPKTPEPAASGSK
jgi:Leucine-rich repeat (LRR) protein